ncbi:MAG: hypothetical protein ACXABY_03515 [Candidatus Thorarchaeota archaeon]|jgi:hypothetical protein
MNTIPLSEMRKLSGEDLEKALPLMVTVNGIERFVLEVKENVIALGDLHPAIRRNLRAQETKARIGMPPSEALTAEDLKQIEGMEIPKGLFV